MTAKAWLVWMALLLGILGLTGCTSLNTVARAEGSGEQIAYKASFDEVQAVMPEVITAAGLKYVNAENDKRIFLAKHGISIWGWGENVAIFVRNVENGKTSVEVVTMPKLTTNITAPDWDGPIFTQLDKRFKRD